MIPVSSSPAIGQRVEIHPRFDAWMQGDRYGTVVKMLRGDRVCVRLDKSGRVRSYALEDLAWIS